jgi:hypothetical protein
VANLTVLDLVLTTQITDGTPIAETPVASPGRGLACHISRLGHYYAANGTTGQIMVSVSRKNRFGPRSPGVLFDLVNIAASAGPGDQDPDMEDTPDGRVALVWHNDTGGWFNWTDSRGKTWSTPTMAIPDARHLRQRCDLKRNLLIVASVPTNPADLTQPIELKGMVQRAIDRWPNDNHSGADFATSSDPAFSIVDAATGLTIVVEDTAPGLDRAADGTFRLVIVEGGAGSESHWWSDDIGKSFNKIA